MAEAACISINSPDAVWLQNGERIKTQIAVIEDPELSHGAVRWYMRLFLHCVGSRKYRIGATELGKECGFGRTKSYAHQAALIDRRYVERDGEMLAIIPLSCRSQVRTSPEPRTVVRDPGLHDLMEGVRAVVDRSGVDNASTHGGQRSPHRVDSPIVDRARGPEEKETTERTTTTEPPPSESEPKPVAADPKPEAEMVRNVTALRIPEEVAAELVASAQAKIGKDAVRSLWATVIGIIDYRKKRGDPITSEGGFARRALESPHRYMTAPLERPEPAPSPSRMSPCIRCKRFYDPVQEGWDGSDCCLDCREALENQHYPR
jgi:hypothetical protein